MHSSKSLITLAFLGAAVIVCIGLVQCQQNGSNSGFGASRPASVIFEPTLSFIRQNLRLVNSYVALLRSIFVGAYDRPLITSTDAPTSATKGPSPVVPPMDLPRRSRL